MQIHKHGVKLNIEGCIEIKIQNLIFNMKRAPIYTPRLTLLFIYFHIIFSLSGCTEDKDNIALEEKNNGIDVSRSINSSLDCAATEARKENEQFIKDPRYLRKQKKYFVVYILVHGMHATHECLKPLKREILNLGENDVNFIIHIAKDREGRTHESIDWQAKSVLQETEQFLDKDTQVLNAIKEGRKLVVVYIGHSLGGVVLDSMVIHDEFKRKNQIEEVLFVMLTAPLKGLDGNPTKMLELKTALSDALIAELSSYPLGDNLIPKLQEALDANFDPTKLPINSNSPGLKGISRAERLGKAICPANPTLCVAAQCPGLFLLYGLGDNFIYHATIDHILNDLPIETKQNINALWVEMLDNKKNHDGIVPTDSQTYSIANSNLTSIKLEGVSHSSVLHDPQVPRYIYNYVKEEVVKLRSRNL